MKAKDIEIFVEVESKKVCEMLGFDFVACEYANEAGNYYLRIFIDKKDGITIDECAKFSRLIGEIIDKKDPIEVSYVLEVSSPGLDRLIKSDEDFEKFVGVLVDIKLYKKVEKRKEFTGVLLGKSDNKITIRDENDIVFEFPEAQVASTRLTVIF